LIEGSNMAECHPVAFQWVVEAKARGAKVIHVDPRFTRTSALADLHVPLRAGSDIVFLGAIINYVLEHERYFKEYVVSYTNASAIIDERFQDTEDADGLFSGWDPERRTYDNTASGRRWMRPTRPRLTRPCSTPAVCSSSCASTSAATPRSWSSRSVACPRSCS
jgi:formate dehydrogenase major subunit